MIGNENTRRYFEKNIAAHTLPHAFIIEGAEGSGRHLLVREAALSLAFESGATHDMQSRIAGEFSPDIIKITLSENRKTLGVDAVRAIRETLNLRPSELEFKLYIIEHGELLTVPAQNAALKILEEPPRETYFFIITTSASALLPTVRSRCSLIRTEPLGHADIERALLEIPALARLRSNDKARFNAAIAASEGRVGEAIHLLSKKSASSDALDIASIAATLVSEAIDGNALRFLAGQKGDREETAAIVVAAMKIAAARAVESGDYRFISLYDALSEAQLALTENANVTLARFALAEKLSHL